MDTGLASGVTDIAAARATPLPQPAEAPDDGAAAGAGDATPPPPAYLLRQASAADPPDQPGNAPPGEDQQPLMPAVMALVEAGEPGEAPQNLPLVVEALLFAAEEAPTVSQLAQATNVSRDAIEQALDALSELVGNRGLRLQRSGNSVCLVTAPEAAPFIQRLLGLHRPNKLSKAALETLAIIAYQQPVTRGAIERVRGVTSDAPLATLRLRDLIASVGQASTPGRPHLWGTTPAFLDHFGLTELSELPSLPEVRPPVTQGVLGLEEHGDPDLESAAERSTDGERRAEGTALAGPEPVALAPVGMPPPPPEEDLGGLAAAGGD